MTEVNRLLRPTVARYCNPVIAALRRGNLSECCTDVCAELGEIPAASAGMTEWVSAFRNLPLRRGPSAQQTGGRPGAPSTAQSLSSAAHSAVTPP